MSMRPLDKSIPQHARRDFTPGKTARFGRPTFSPDKLVRYSPKWGYSRIFNFPFQGSHWRPRMHTIVVAVNGVSKKSHLVYDDKDDDNDDDDDDDDDDKNQNDLTARGAWAVFFGRKCPRNKFGCLTGPLSTQTNNRAALEAVRQALLSVNEMHLSGSFDTFRFAEVIIKTDSVYIHDTFNQYVWNYEGNHYIKFDGSSVKHAPLIQEIHQLICELEAENRAVRFWVVGRRWNRGADRLANLALTEQNQRHGRKAEQDSPARHAAPSLACQED